MDGATSAPSERVVYRNRTTTPMSYNDFQALADEEEAKSKEKADVNSQEPNTIFYLKTIHRKLIDVYISNPTAQFTDILEVIANRMQDYGSEPGLNAIQELVNSPGFLTSSLECFKAPLPDGSMLELNIIREDNPEIWQALPRRRTFTVRCGSPLIVPEGMIPGPDGRAQVKDIEVYRTFISSDAALSFARTKFAELQTVHDDSILSATQLPPDNVILSGVVGIIDRETVGGEPYDQHVEIRNNEPRAQNPLL